MKAYLALLTTIALFSTPAYSYTPFWLGKAIKKSNPEQLAYFASGDEECLVSTNEVNQVVEGILIRSRIKPITSWSSDPLYLAVKVACSQHDTGIFGFSIDIGYGSKISMPPIRYDHNFGAVGTAENKKYILDLLRRTVETAVTEYLKANFDL